MGDSATEAGGVEGEVEVGAVADGEHGGERGGERRLGVLWDTVSSDTEKGRNGMAALGAIGAEG